jgi:mono/diheme cytochrome c family protein
MMRPNSRPQKYLRLSERILVLSGFLLAQASGGVVLPIPTAGSDSVGGQVSAQDGIYSDAQRQRGLQVYLKQCSSCHGERLRGGESAPALIGANFREHWSGHTVGDLLQKVNLMPPKDPGRLSPEEAVSLIAVILAANSFPAGATDLPATPSLLQQILIDSRKSP